MHFRRLRFGLLGSLLHDLDPHHLCRDCLAQIGKKGLEQFEALGLVFVQRIPLRIAAEADHGAKMIKIDQMLAPQMVKCLQED